MNLLAVLVCTAVLLLCQQLISAKSDRLVNPNVPIIIVGAGAAGLSAAQRLHEAGFRDVTIFEAENRTGGRVFTHEDDAGLVELGAGRIRGEDPVLYPYAVLKNAVGRNVDTDSIVGYMTPDRGGKSLADSGHSTGELFSEFALFHEITASFKYPSGISPAAQHNESVEQTRHRKYRSYDTNADQYYWRNVAYDYGVRTEMVNTSCPDPKLLSHFTYTNYTHVGGTYDLKPTVSFTALLNNMTRTFPRKWLKTGWKVERIIRDETSAGFGLAAGIRVRVRRLKDDKIREQVTRHVVLTVSLGVLKACPHLFETGLSVAKMIAIKKTGFGDIAKLFLRFDAPFWDTLPQTNITDHGLLFLDEPLATPQPAARRLPNTYPAPRPWYRYITQLAPVALASSTILVTVGGPGALMVDTITNTQLLDDISPILQRSFQSVHGLTFPIFVPRAVSVLREKWSANPHFKGAFSYYSLASSRDGYSPRDLAAPEWEIQPTAHRGSRHALLFAGEATHSEYFSTVQGAILSGQREAERLHSYYLLNGGDSIEAANVRFFISCLSVLVLATLQ